MNKILLIIVSFFVSFPAFADEKQDKAAFDLARKNFRYIAEYPNKDNWYRYNRIDKLFIGDCEDFAFTLQKQIGGEVWHVLHKYTTPHAVLVKDGYAYDYLYNRRIKKKRYPGRFNHIMRFEFQELWKKNKGGFNVQ